MKLLTIGLGISAAALALGGAGYYALKLKAPSSAPVERRQSAQTAPAMPPAPQPGTASPPISEPPGREKTPFAEKPPFTIALPVPFNEADNLQFLARAYAAGRVNDADTAMARSLLSSPASRAAAQWLLARSGVPLSFQWYMEFRRNTPDWPQSTSFARRIETALLTSPMPDAEKARYLAANPPSTSSGQIFMGKQLLNSGHRQEALAMIRPAWTSERLLDTTEKQIRTDYAGLLTPQDHRNRMIFLMAGKNWDAALRAAKDAGDGAEALVKARMAVIGASKKAQAEINALPKAVQSDSLASFLRLLMLIRQKKTKDAADIFARLTSEQGAPALSPPECRDWRTQQRTLVRALLDASDFTNAYQLASASLSRRGCTHNDSDFQAGWIALRYLDRPEAAIGHFETLTANAESNTQKARAAYWLGRVAERLGDRGKADEAYRQAARFWTSFYGQLAAKNLGLAEALPVPQEDNPPGIGQELEKTSAWQAIRLMEAGGAGELALPLYAEIASILPDRPQLMALAALAESTGNARAVVNIGRIAARRGFNLGASAYPTFGLPEIAGKSNPADLTLLYAIAHQESAFYAKAKSSAGALGLMQLMPATARMTATRNGLAFDINRLTGDPGYNVRLGLAHFNDLQTEWKGSLILSFAAYNAGGGNVRKWIAAYGDPRSPGVDAIDWIERIPFMETRHYVQRLTENLSVYRRLMGVALPSPVGRNDSGGLTRIAMPERAKP